MAKNPTTKNPYGIISYGEYSLRRAFLTAKWYCGKVSLSQKILQHDGLRWKNGPRKNRAKAWYGNSRNLKKYTVSLPTVWFRMQPIRSAKLRLRKKKNIVSLFLSSDPQKNVVILLSSMLNVYALETKYYTG